MNCFDEREEAFERRFAADEGLNFKALVRRNKLLGLGAAELTGKSAVEADAYAKEIVAAQVERADDKAPFETLSAELEAADVEMSDHHICRKIAQMTEQARKEIAAGS